ncbi:MAG: hypothetical protein GXY83_12435 [Rhodopirellula sp.]|nr:hypothetical protein [Rhodopirellula sp.]
MLDAIRERYGVWTSRALLSVTNGTGRVEWPGRGEYETELGVFVGPDARRWIWIAPPPGRLQLPHDLRVQGVRPRGRTAAGQEFGPVETAPSALSAGTDMPTRVLLRVDGLEFTILHRPRQDAPVQVEYTLINAIFDGVDWSPDSAAGAEASRIDKFSFTNGPRQWVLQWLPTFRKADIDNLSNGIVQMLPTATLATTVDSAAELADAEDEAYAITRLLSLVTGSSVGGAKRRILRGGHVTEETYLEWANFGTSRTYKNHALICNCPELADSLRSFMTTAVAPYRAQDNDLGLSRVIGYLEQARSNNVADIRVALCVFALEALTHRLCLRDGLTPDQLAKMNIQQKLNRCRNRMGMGFIDKHMAEEARDTVRNPLLHTGEIPGLSMPEKVKWYDDLYALAFKMLLFLLGYKGKWFDLSDQWNIVNAPA